MALSKKRIHSIFWYIIWMIILMMLPFSSAFAQTQQNQTIIINGLFADSTFLALLTQLPEPIALRVNDATTESLLMVQEKLSEHSVTLTSSFSNQAILELAFIPSNTLIRQTRKTYQRNLVIRTGVTIINGSGEITTVKLLDFTYTDIVSSVDRRSLESDWKPSQFTTIERNKTHRVLKRYVEPVVISAAIGTTVYLLYNVRSR